MAVSTPSPVAPVSGPSDDPTSLLPTKLARARPLFDPEIVSRAARESFVKLSPLTLWKNPVMRFRGALWTLYDFLRLSRVIELRDSQVAAGAKHSCRR